MRLFQEFLRQNVTRGEEFYCAGRAGIKQVGKVF